jgi:hypothetical protein
MKPYQCSPTCDCIAKYHALLSRLHTIPDEVLTIQDLREDREGITIMLFCIFSCLRENCPNYELAFRAGRAMVEWPEFAELRERERQLALGKKPPTPKKEPKRFPGNAQTRAELVRRWDKKLAEEGMKP